MTRKRAASSFSREQPISTGTTQFDVDSELVERYVLELAAHGRHGDTGVARAVYSPEWARAQDAVARWCAKAGLEVERDTVGNVWGKLRGASGGPSIVTGSHIDTQLPGGRYDGALGVVAAVVALRLLQERFGQPLRTLEAVSLCEEEGSRFPTASFWGSRAITNQIRESDLHDVRDRAGITIADAMRSAGLDPERAQDAARDDIDCFIELHIEQGPALEDAGLPVAVVTAITGLRHYVVTMRGRSDHAGARPMHRRRDPMAAAAEAIHRMIEDARAIGAPAVTTIGRISVEPNIVAAVPAEVTFSVDVRHPDVEALEGLYRAHERTLREAASRHDVDCEFRITLDLQPSACDEELVRGLESAAARQGIPFMKMHSGAGHDAQQMAARSKVAMIFVRSQDGRSHAPEEFTATSDAVDGIAVLARALYSLAYR
jgi:allantoate deiminase